MLAIEVKVCNKCKLSLPATKEYFYARKKNKDGLRYECKKCASQYQKEAMKGYWKKRYHEDDEYRQYRREWDKQYYENNKENKLQYRKHWYEANKEKARESHRQWCEANKEKVREHNRQWRENNREKARECGRQWRENNPEKVRERNKSVYANNAEKIKERVKQWRLDNPEAWKLKVQKRTALRRGASKSDFTIEQWEEAKKAFNKRCAYCGKAKKLEQEHFTPLSNGGNHSRGNIIPACKSCNCSKGNKKFVDWYSSHPSYNEKREEQILEYINLEYEKLQCVSTQ